MTNKHGVTVWCPCGCGARQVRHSADCEDVQAAWLAHCDRNDGQPAPYELVKATSTCAGAATGDPMANDSPERIDLMSRVIGLEAELRAEKAHADRWQLLAGRYDDIRYALRNAPDTPEGHAFFYNDAAELIFGSGQ